MGEKISEKNIIRKYIKNGSKILDDSKIYNWYMKRKISYLRAQQYQRNFYYAERE